MDQSRAIIKVPVFLKLLEHYRIDLAQKKFKGTQTITAVGRFLAIAPQEVARKFIKLIVDSDIGTARTVSIFYAYRSEKLARAFGAKGRLPVKNVMTVDSSGRVVEQTTSAKYDVQPITSEDITQMVITDFDEPAAVPDGGVDVD